MKLPELESAILRTLLYFDMQDYPLTAFEVWKWLYEPNCPEEERTLQKVTDALESSEHLKTRITRTEGFYHTIGRARIVHERKRRNNRMDDQMDRVIRMMKFLRLFSPIRMIAIASSLSSGNVKETSDIDLFIVARRRQVWLARFFAAGFLKVLRQRPEPESTKDRFCLTFFVAEHMLDVSSGAMGQDDIVYHYYIQSFVPVYDAGGVYASFLKENEWLAKHLPHGHAPQQHVHALSVPAWLSVWHRVLDFVLWPFVVGPMKDWYRIVQLRILPRSLKSIANIDSRVIISDTMLKFHDKDNRKELLKRWNETCQEHGI